MKNFRNPIYCPIKLHIWQPIYCLVELQIWQDWKQYTVVRGCCNRWRFRIANLIFNKFCIIIYEQRDYMILTVNRDYFLKQHNKLIFVMVKSCVFFAVRTIMLFLPPRNSVSHFSPTFSLCFYSFAILPNSLSLSLTASKG
jgi:hypothetical protein